MKPKQDTIDLLFDTKKFTLIDLKKAFDTVDHSILLENMSHYGIRDTANLWLTNYLTEREQFVSVHGRDS